MPPLNAPGSDPPCGSLARYYLEGQLVLALDFNSTYATQPDAFQHAAYTDLLAVMGLHPSRLHVFDCREGSVVLDFRVSPPGFQDVGECAANPPAASCELRLGRKLRDSRQRVP
jgi:hypothetical protein